MNNLFNKEAKEGFIKLIKAKLRPVFARAYGEASPGLFLLAVWLVFFSRTLFGHRVYFLDDLKIIYLPLEWLYRQYQHAWQLPLWSDVIGFGHPLLAWGQLGYLNLWHMLLRVFYLQPLTLLQISVLSYFGFGLFGAYIFLRYQRFSQATAVLGAVTYAFNGFNVGHLNHVNFYTVTMLLPWLLLAISVLAKKVTRRRIIFVSLTAAQMALSGQPQIVLYSFIAAGLWAVILLMMSANKIKFLAALFFSGILAFCLASLAILPLAEFVPLSDRAGGISREALMEFSYPPWHAITLLWPYFFGDHTVYWGAKNFQELAAYVGIIPLLLAGVGLFTGKRPGFKLWAVILTVGGVFFAFGEYSPLYNFLVSYEIIKSIAVPGRFIFFFTIGATMLALLGLEEIKTVRRPLLLMFLSLLPILAIFLPFWWYATNNLASGNRMLELLSWRQIDTWMIAGGFLLFIITVYGAKTPSYGRTMNIALVGWASMSLIIYGWNYNPLSPAYSAYQSSPFLQYLQSYRQQNARTPRLLQTMPLTSLVRKRTEQIAPNFTVLQPIVTSRSRIDCFNLPCSADQTANGIVKIEIKEAWNKPALRLKQVETDKISGSTISFCVDPLDIKPGQNLLLSFSSDTDSGLHLVQEQETRTHRQAYFIRPQKPTNDQVEASRKTARILTGLDGDQGNAQITLGPHLNVLAQAGSGNWIGALALAPYRMLVTKIFADGGEQIDGDGHHVVETYRRIIDAFGITHLIEQKTASDFSSYLTDNGFIPVATSANGDTITTLYQNQTVRPRAYLVGKAIFSPANDETIFAMIQPGWRPEETLFIDGPIPPRQLSTEVDIVDGQASITRSETTAIDVDVKTNQAAWLVLTDASTPQWKTYIDGQPAPYYRGNTILKTAFVPAGQHTVSFRYESAAVKSAEALTMLGLTVAIVGMFWPAKSP